MIAPANRLLVLSALVILPLLTAAWVQPSLAAIVWAVLGLFILALIADAVIGLRSLAEIAVAFPAGVRWTKDRMARLPVKLTGSATVSANFPPELPAERTERELFTCT